MREKQPASTIKDKRQARKNGKGGGKRSVAKDYIVVVENLPDRIPITPRLLEVIETYLGDVLDEIFSAGKLEAERAETHQRRGKRKKA